METSKKITSMRLYAESLERFNSHGRKNQSSDALLNDVLDVYEKFKAGTLIACHSIDDAVRTKPVIVEPSVRPPANPHVAQARELVLKIETLTMKGFDLDEACHQAAGKRKRSVYFNALENLMKENAYTVSVEYVEWLKRNGKYSAWVRGIEGLKQNLQKQGFKADLRVPA